MIKLLLLPELLEAALDSKNASVQAWFDQAKKNQNLQLWATVSAKTHLIEKGIIQDRLKSLFDQVATVSLHDDLIEQALQSKQSFALALQGLSAKLYRIDAMVGIQADGSVEGIRTIAYDEVEALETQDHQNKINFLELHLPLHSILNRVESWHAEITQNTAFAGGNHVADFEAEFAEYCGAPYAVGVNSGTDALRFALMAMGIKEGDEVITVPNTFIATTETITQAGAKIRFVDISPETFNMDPELLEKAINPNTKAILPVHLYGQLADMKAILQIADKHGIPVLEDACQAHGAVLDGKRAGSFGVAAAFSMYPGKNLGAFGEAGCIVTHDPKIHKMASSLRDHGQSQKYIHASEGYNGRMDNLQAAALRAKLPLLDDWNQKRRDIARRYLEKLDGLDWIRLPKVKDFQAHVFHLFVVLVENPKELHEYLKKQNIYTGFHYPIALHLQEAYRSFGLGRGSFVHTEKIADRLISLPMFPELNERQIDRICEAIRRFHD